MHYEPKSLKHVQYNQTQEHNEQDIKHLTINCHKMRK